MARVHDEADELVAEFWPGFDDDAEYEAWLRTQPGLEGVIDALLEARGRWDYESPEGFKGRRV